MSIHKDLTGDNVHVIFFKSYADETERLADTTLVATDIGRVARQTDSGAFYVLRNNSRSAGLAFPMRA